ncbi:MAG: cupin domain-containing protein [Sutterella sp.]|nr:cupin domain-containing protein [Sutterella sp.]
MAAFGPRLKKFRKPAFLPGLKPRASCGKFSDAARQELHDALGLTGCEVSVNTLPAGAGIPFVHAHTKNEEVYGVLAGNGELWLDGETHPVTKGDWFRISPAGKRALKAGAEGMSYICIQAKAGSLEGFTATDGVLCEEKAPWMK